MRVPIGDFDALVSNPVSNGNRREAYINEQTDVAMSQIVDSDALDACCLCTPVHLMMEIAFGYRENTIFLFQTVLHFEKLLHLLAEKVGHLNGAVAFLCFR